MRQGSFIGKGNPFARRLSEDLGKEIICFSYAPVISDLIYIANTKISCKL
jgi:hypothetical protein